MRLRIGQRWTQLLGWIADRPRGSAVAATLLLVAFASVIRPPIIEGSLVDHMSASNPQLEIERRITAATGDPSAAAIIVTPGDLAIGETFAEIDRLSVALAAVDGRVAVHSINSAAPQLFAYELTLQSPVSHLLVALRDNPQANTLISAGATSFLVAVVAPDAVKLDVLEVLAAHEWGVGFNNTTVLAGAQLERDVIAALSKDLRLLIPVIVAFTLLALFIAFGNWRALLLPLFASVASTVVTFALLSILVVPINLVTLLSLPVVLIVGLANSCHFLAKSEAAGESRANIVAALRQTLQRVGPPFFFSTLTTAIALASLGFNEIPPIASLGLLSAAALLIVFPLVLLAAPLSLRWYLAGSSRPWQSSRWFVSASAWLAAWRPHVSVLLLLLTLGGAASIPLLTVKSDPRAFFPDNAPFSAALSSFESQFYFFSPLRVLITFDETDPLAALRSAGVVRDALLAQQSVRQVDMRPAVEPGNAYVLVALLATEQGLGAAQTLLDAAAPAGATELVYSNASLVYRDIDRQAMDSLLRSLGWSLALIFGSILIVFRSVRVVLGAMLTNAVPLLLVCGTVWLIGSPLNLVTVFVFLVALGVVVDDSIHILFWRAAGDDVSGSSIEFSVLMSTFMLCLGLLLCQLSDFPTTRQFAAYCAVALVTAVVSNLSILPLLLGAARPSDGR